LPEVYANAGKRSAQRAQAKRAARRSRAESIRPAERRRRRGLRPRRTRQAGERVEVRVSPRGRALRIDGTFASWWTPGTAATGGVWDALAAPVLMLPPARRRSLLVLGLGGGSAARLLRALAPRARIVGVERDPAVLRAARRRLGLAALGLEVVQADAQDYLASLAARFDLIVEDLFVGRGRAVHKPGWLAGPALARLADHLTPGGLLVSNALDEAAATARAFERLFPATLCLSVQGYDNRVLVGARTPLTACGLREELVREPLLAGTLPRLRLRTLSGSARAPRPGTRARSG
jgi:SAM-dependent methyltransferase